MRTGLLAKLRLALIAVSLAAGVGVCLLADKSAMTARAAQKDKDKSGTIYLSDPACDYLTGFEPTVEKAGKITPGIAACRACHSGSDVGQAKGFVDSYKSNEFVKLNESTTWDEQDIHAAAMKCLTDPLGKQMEDILKKHRPEGYTVAKAPECLTCHSVDMSPKMPLADKKYENFATLPGGVTCTLCHGLHQKWQNEHFEEPTQAGQPLPWRSKPPTYKYATGMLDLRNPVVKATLCVSCHVGNHAEGKVVTHEMYAAGHPPLPPFELASYMEGEPRHWGYATELKFFESVKATDTWKLFHFHPEKTETYLARHYAVGAIASLRAEAEVLQGDAERAQKAQEPLDYARFDCYACHHELRSPSDRQKRGYGNDPPGRAPLRAAAGIPAGLVAKHAEGIEAGGLKAKAAGFDEKWSNLRKAATAKPFGDPVKLQAEAKAIREWCDAFLKAQGDTEAPLYTPEQTARLQKMLLESATGTAALADPEVAMALTWGARTLSATPDDKLKDLAAIVPLNVRTKPYSQMVGKKSLPEQAKFPERMKKVSMFEGPKFAEAFKAGFGSPK